VENKLESRTTKTCSENKPLELYIFTDPLCFKCWSLEMVIKKLELEYSHYFTLSYILSCKISRLNPACSGRKAKGGYPKTLLEYCLGSGREQERKNDPPFIASIAVKAAELQGKKQGDPLLPETPGILILPGDEHYEPADIDRLCKGGRAGCRGI